MTDLIMTIEISQKAAFNIFKLLSVLTAAGAIVGMVMMLWADKMDGKKTSAPSVGLMGCCITILCLICFIVFSMLGGSLKPM